MTPEEMFLDHELGEIEGQAKLTMGDEIEKLTSRIRQSEEKSIRLQWDLGSAESSVEFRTLFS